MSLIPEFHSPFNLNFKSALCTAVMIGSLTTACTSPIKAAPLDSQALRQIQQEKHAEYVVKGCEDFRDKDNLYRPQKPAHWVKQTPEDMAIMNAKIAGYDYGMRDARTQKKQTGEINCDRDAITAVWAYN